MNGAERYTPTKVEKDLAAGILEQATQDLRRFRNPTSEVERELYHGAYCWVMSDDCSWPFSFLNVCQLLKLAPENLRQDLLDDASLGLFGYLSRRCVRAARSLQDFGNRVFTTNRPSIAVDPVPRTHGPTA